MSGARILRVRCVTWDQVEAFYTRKLRRGRVLSMRVPFAAEPNAEVTLGLELPNQMVVVIDGTVTQVGDEVDGKTAVEINLHGVTPELVARLETLVADGRATPGESDDGEPTSPAPDGEPATAEVAMLDEETPEPAPDPVASLSESERAVYQSLEGELLRMRELAAHEVLGVSWGATPEEVRSAWIALGRRFHPDVMARHRSPALGRVCEEIAIHVNRAYDRMRAALVAEGRAAAVGPSLHPARGWLIGFDELDTGDRAFEPHDPPVVPRFRSSVRFDNHEPLREDELFGDLKLDTSDGAGELAMPTARAAPGEAFERQARARLASGDHAAAREILSAALHVYPRSGTLRALYHVASAMDALDGGQSLLATSQLEAALVQDPGCCEAAVALDALRQREGDGDGDVLRRLFQ